MDGNTASNELVEANAKKILDIKTQIHELLKEAEQLADEQQEVVAEDEQEAVPPSEKHADGIRHNIVIGDAL